MADPYVRVTIRGSLPGGEVWSVNPVFIGNFDTSPPNQADLQLWADVIASDMAIVYPQQLRGMLSSSAAITGTRVNLYGADGRLSRYAERDLGTPLAGGDPLGSPTTQAVVGSLYSAVPSRRTRGRLFFPALALELDTTTARIPTSSCVAIASGVRNMLLGIEQRSPDGNNVVAGIWSKTAGSGIAVTAVRVGNVVDSMRRRRDALEEIYAVQQYP